MALVVLMLSSTACWWRDSCATAGSSACHNPIRCCGGCRVTPYQLGIRQLVLVAVLAYAWHVGAWDAASVGVHHPDLWMESILAGEIGFLALMVGYTLLMWLAGRMRTMRLAAVRGNLRIWPRKRSLKIVATIFFVMFNPFTEELVMRGILIHQWGLLLGSPVVPIGSAWC
jgi:membrane protease YdiL (CAAX protease family)